MRNLLPFIAIVLFFSSNAYAQQMHDYSLSPAETARYGNNNTNNSQTQGAIGGVGQQPYGTQQAPNGGLNGDFPAPMMPPENATTPSGSYMDGYCDKNFRAGVANNNAAIMACLQQQKEQSCAQYQQLPNDAKSVLNTAITCTARMLSGENTDTQNSGAGCAETDGVRMQLLKKYWRDVNTAYALVFLPDDVLDNSSKCLRGGR